MDDFNDDSDRVKHHARRRRDFEDYQVIAGHRWGIVLGWGMLVVGIAAGLALCVILNQPLFLNRSGAGAIALTIVVVMSFDKNESPIPLMICGALWFLASLYGWYTYAGL